MNPGVRIRLACHDDIAGLSAVESRFYIDNPEDHAERSSYPRRKCLHQPGGLRYRFK